jgi:hypothetical protein
MISSGPLAGGHLQSEQGEMQGEMGVWVPVVIVLMLVLVIEKPMKQNDHEQEHEHDYEKSWIAGGCALAVAHYNRSALRP